MNGGLVAARWRCGPPRGEVGGAGRPWVVTLSAMRELGVFRCRGRGGRRHGCAVRGSSGECVDVAGDRVAVDDGEVGVVAGGQGADAFPAEQLRAISGSNTSARARPARWRIPMEISPGSLSSAPVGPTRSSFFHHDLADIGLALLRVLAQREGDIVEQIHRAEQRAVLEPHTEQLADLLERLA